MNTLLPFGLPWPTAMYLTLYIVTLVIHVLLMNYVLAACGCVAWGTMRRAVRAATEHAGEPMPPLEATLRDWLPFALGAAITAGVAPLLFVQLLYKTHFYTANLLLFHRWMSLLPALIVGFYLLYVLKTRAVGNGPWWAAPLVATGAFLCFGYTAWAWTENHLLSLNAPIWPAFHGARSMWYRDPLLLPRLGMWTLGALPGLAVIAGWQMRQNNRATRTLAILAIVGMLLAGGCAWSHHAALPTAAQHNVTGTLARPWLMAALIGAAAQAAAWLWLIKVSAGTTPVSRTPLTVITVGWIAMALGMTMVREAIRLSAIDITRLYDEHARLAQAGGLPWFLLFFVISAAAIVWCVRLVRLGRAATPVSSGNC